MVFTEPYKQNNYIVYPGDVRTHNLSFAVWLIDDFTKGKPIGNIWMEIEKTGKKAFKNLSGYYCFTGLKAGNYIVNIKSELYFPEKIEDAMSAISSDTNNPVVEVNDKPEVVLKPNPAYPFPASATLVRGRIKSVSGDTVAGLRVSVDEKDIENLTDSRGEFVLYFKNIVKTEDVNLIINGEADGHSITVKEGKTVSTTISTQ